MIHLDIIQANRKKFDGQVAIIEKGVAKTWADFEREVLRHAGNLLERGLERIVALCENSPNAIFLASACSSLRIPLCFLDPSGGPDLYKSCFKALQPQAIVFSPDYEMVARNESQRTGIQAIGLDTLRENPRGATPDECRQFAIARPLELYSLTSGTTGVPKVVFRDRSFDPIRFRYFIERFRFNETNIFLVAAPFHHASSAGWIRLFLSVGAKVVLSELDAPSLMKAYLTNTADSMVIPPKKLSDMMEFVSAAKIRISHRAYFILVGGKNFSPYQKKKALDSFGNAVYEYYGTTESGVNSLATPVHFRNFPSSSGEILPGNEIVFVDEDCNLTDPEIGGRLAIASYQNMKAYISEERQPFVTFGEKSYFLTPDSGHIKDGLLYVVNRQAAMGSMNCYAIEDELLRVRSVCDVFVNRTDDNLQVFVALQDQSALEDVVSDCRQILRNWVVPIEIHVVSQIPYSSTGKVRIRDLQKNLLKEFAL